MFGKGIRGGRACDARTNDSHAVYRPLIGHGQPRFGRAGAHGLAAGNSGICHNCHCCFKASRTAFDLSVELVKPLVRLW